MNLEEKDLDSIRRIELNEKTYFNVKDLSKIIRNPKPSNLVKWVDKDSIVKEKIEGHRELFVDSFGLTSIFVKSRNEDLSRESSGLVFKYICRKGYVNGGFLDYTLDPPLEVALRYQSRYNMGFFNGNSLPTLSGIISVGENNILIYSTGDRFPLFSVTDLSNAFSVPMKRLLSKISIWNREKMVKMDSMTGDRFSWFTGTAGVLEIIMKVRDKNKNERNKKIFNTLINIIKDERN